MRNLLSCTSFSFEKSTIPMPPAATKGSTMSLMLNLNPSNETIHPVMVVPMLAPNIMPIPFLRPMIPAPVNDITSSDTMVLLCSMPVTNAPETAAFKGLPVFLRRKSLNDLPANAFSASSSMNMPKRNKPKPASKGHMCILSKFTYENYKI